MMHSKRPRRFLQRNPRTSWALTWGCGAQFITQKLNIIILQRKVPFEDEPYETPIPENENVKA